MENISISGNNSNSSSTIDELHPTTNPPTKLEVLTFRKEDKMENFGKGIMEIL